VPLESVVEGKKAEMDAKKARHQADAAEDDAVVAVAFAEAHSRKRSTPSATLSARSTWT
jgi:hypothetical protein